MIKVTIVVVNETVGDAQANIEELANRLEDGWTHIEQGVDGIEMKMDVEIEPILAKKGKGTKNG